MNSLKNGSKVAYKNKDGVHVGNIIRTYASNEVINQYLSKETRRIRNAEIRLTSGKFAGQIKKVAAWILIGKDCGLSEKDLFNMGITYHTAQYRWLFPSI